MGEGGRWRRSPVSLLRVSPSPRLRVSPCPLLRVSPSPRLRVSLFHKGAFPPDCPSVLILAQSQENRVSNLLVVGPQSERNFAYQLGPDPVDRGIRFRLDLERTVLLNQAIKTRPHFGESLLVEPGPHMADVDQITIVVDAQ